MRVHQPAFTVQPPVPPSLSQSLQPERELSRPGQSGCRCANPPPVEPSVDSLSTDRSKWSGGLCDDALSPDPGGLPSSAGTASHTGDSSYLQGKYVTKLPKLRLFTHSISHIILRHGKCIKKYFYCILGLGLATRDVLVELAAYGQLVCVHANASQLFRSYFFIKAPCKQQNDRLTLWGNFFFSSYFGQHGLLTLNSFACGLNVPDNFRKLNQPSSKRCCVTTSRSCECYCIWPYYCGQESAFNL